MANAQLAGVLRHIHQLADADPRRNDACLLHSFLASGDEASFRLLVERHGRMVLGVCQTVLRQRQDAEDAFQATFLVLARKAASIREGTALASWLYGVAYRTALKARTQMSKRHLHEKRAARQDRVEPGLDLALRELQTVLAEEVERLPDKLRAPFVLCCLEGKSRSDAALQLGWKEGTVFGRLAQARKLLHERLSRRGLTLAAALSVAALADAGAVPSELIHATTQAGRAIAAGQTAAGLVSGPVAHLAEGVAKSMFRSKIKLAGILLLAAGIAASGVGLRLHHAPAAPPSENRPTSKQPAARKDAPAKDRIDVSGRVLDLEGRPIKNATVRVVRIEAPDGGDLTPVLKSIHRDGNRVFHHPLHTEDLKKRPDLASPVPTDEKGRFRLAGIPKERLVILRVEGPTIEHRVLYVLTRLGIDLKELDRAAARTVMPGMPRTTLPAIYGPTFDHTAAPTRPIVGTVRDRATGKPVADVSVSGSSGGWWEDYVMTKTDKDGRYRLIGMPKSGSYRINAYGADKDYLPAQKPAGDTEGLAPVAVDFELVHGIRVKGRITDKDTGKPVPAALWYVPLADNKFFPTLPGKDWYRFTSEGHRTEKDGSFSLLALPGSGLIRVRAEVPDNPYTLAVIARADEPKAYSTKDEGLGQSFLSAGGAIESLFDANAYRLIDPAADAKSLSLEIQLDRGRTRTGTVVGPEGKPLAGARAGGLSARGGNKTLPDSSFQAIALNPAKARLIVFAHKERKLVGHVRLDAEGKDPLTVHLAPGAVLTGRVLDEDGKPLAGLTVRAGYRSNEARWLAEEMGLGTQQTDAQGRFRIDCIFPGLECGLAVQKGNRFFVTEAKYLGMRLEAGSKDLGDVKVKPFRPE